MRLDTEAKFVDLERHGEPDTGQFLIMLLFKGEALLQDKEPSQNGCGTKPAYGSNLKLKAARACCDYVASAAQLRQNLKEEKRMLFVVAELHLLDSVAWRHFYADAVKICRCSCPIVVWHPMRNKCQIIDCIHVQTSQHVLEQTLDGNVKSWLPRPWPA